MARSRGFYIGVELPKYPGNAVEVFAGAMAIYDSIDSVKAWVEEAFESIIQAAVDAWQRYHKCVLLFSIFSNVEGLLTGLHQARQ